MNELCFNASFNPGHPARYDVNVTDITGYLTSVSGQYDSSHCLSLSSVLQPASCTPLEIAVTASNDFGSSLPLTDYIRSDALNGIPACLYLDTRASSYLQLVGGGLR